MLKEIRIRTEGGPGAGTAGRLCCQGCAARCGRAGAVCPIGLPPAEPTPAGAAPSASAPGRAEEAGTRLDVRVLRRAGYRLVRLVGEADLATACELHFRLTDELDQAPRLAVDVSGLEFIEMLGIRMLWRAADRAVREGGWVRLIGPRPQFRRLLELCGAATVLPVFEDEDAMRISAPPATRARYTKAKTR